MVLTLVLLAALAAGALAPTASRAAPRATTSIWQPGLGSDPRHVTDATYFNDGALPAADPYVLHDPRSGYYYAYSTEGADPGYDFAIYRSADLVTWEKAAPGALPVNDPNQWGTDWFWAPETYYNTRTGLYYMFYAARSAPNAQAVVRVRRLRGAVQDRGGGLPLAGRPVSQHRQPPDRLQPLRPQLPRRQPDHGARPAQAAGHAAAGRDGAAGNLYPADRPRRAVRRTRADGPVLLAERLPQLGVGHRPAQVHRGVHDPCRAAHQRLVERPHRHDDADDRPRLPGH